MRVLCEACGAETDQSWGNYLKLLDMSGMSRETTRAWCHPCGERVLDAIDSVTVPVMAEVAPLRAAG
jgi:hypothetical protein